MNNCMCTLVASQITLSLTNTRHASQAREMSLSQKWASYRTQGESIDCLPAVTRSQLLLCKIADWFIPARPLCLYKLHCRQWPTGAAMSGKIISWLALTCTVHHIHFFTLSWHLVFKSVAWMKCTLCKRWGEIWDLGNTYVLFVGSYLWPPIPMRKSSLDEVMKWKLYFSPVFARLTTTVRRTRRC